MKTNISIMTHLSLGILFTLFTATSAFCKGGDSGGGGDARCAEYVDLANSISNTLRVIGQNHINSLSKVIKVEEIKRVSQALICLPVNALDRQARSYPDDGHTDLLGSAWDSLNPTQKLRLTAHELSVLTLYEVDGDYTESSKIYSLLQEKQNQAGSLPSCKELKYYRSPKVGDKCMTSKLAIFERVAKTGFGEAWKGPDGVTWGDLIFSRATLERAKELCKQFGGELPDDENVLRGDALGFTDVLPNVQSGDYLVNNPGSNISSRFIGNVYLGYAENNSPNTFRCISRK